MHARGIARWAILAAVPLLTAAADPAGDVVGCRGGSAGGVPDLVEARGEIVEFGTSARWTLTFSDPLTVPDQEGRPFRIDVAIRDPDVPAVTLAYYRGINRLVRMDATIEHPTQILLVPEHGRNVFIPPTIEGRTVTIQVPGRTLSDDEDLTGTSPGLGRLRWTVIVRDEAACDFLGDGRPTERMVPVRDVAPSRDPGPTPAWPWFVGGGLAVAAIGAVAYRLRR